MHNHHVYKSVVAILLTLSILLCAGCGKPPGIQEPSIDSQNTSFVDGQEPDKDTDTKEPALTPEKQAETALYDLRQQMADSSQVLAVAYLGYFDYTENDLFSFAKKRSPQLWENLQLSTLIPAANVAGDYYGELYIMIPGDPEAAVSICAWGIDENGEEVYEKVIYEQINGEPFLLFCNPAWSPDVQVTITNSDGSIVIWYPMLDKNQCVDQLENANGEDAIRDISSYAEILTADYLVMLENEDSNWSIPTKGDLINTAWGWDGYLEPDLYCSCKIIFREGTADICWDDGIDESNHEYNNAPWELTYENGFAVLTIDFGQFTGVMHHNLLIDKEYGQLFTIVDVSDGQVETGLEPMYRFLTSKPVNVPQPTDMVGTWEMIRSSVEGDTNDAEPGECIIEIRSTPKSGLIMSYTRKDYTIHNFQDELLTIDMRELHTNCGNDQWVADVNYVGPYDTTYAITLTEDGILIKQNYFFLDGFPTVSYEYFCRKEE